MTSDGENRENSGEYSPKPPLRYDSYGTALMLGIPALVTWGVINKRLDGW
jgi:hypothetical protein